MDLLKMHCVPCEGGMLPMKDEVEDTYKKKIPSWGLVRGGQHKLHKEFDFNDFKDAMDFVNDVAEIAEEEGHHPNMHIFYSKVKVELYTHAINGLSESDFIMAAKIDAL